MFRITSLLLVLCSTLAAKPIQVAVTDSPPFSFQGEDGTWSGMTLELWEAMASSQEWEYELVPLTLSETLDKLQAGEIDVAAAALSVTAERDETIDFSHAFYGSGLAIATSQSTRDPFAILSDFFSARFFTAFGSLGLILILAGAAVWIFERKSNSEFGGNWLQGLGNGFWWSAVTMTTVGYGDKSPKTLGGRAVGLVWMFASVIVISGFTAAIASAFAVGSTQPRIESVDDLPRYIVGVVEDSLAARYLSDQGIRYRSFPAAEAGLSAADLGKIDAFVHDEPVLKYLISRLYQKSLTTLPDIFEHNYYALGIPENSPYLKDINIELLEFIQTDAWLTVRREYLGAEEN
ncbi:MAG: transporter substrate-binding domain-containing protein [Opitutales bacterium]